MAAGGFEGYDDRIEETNVDDPIEDDDEFLDVSSDPTEDEEQESPNSIQDNTTETLRNRTVKEAVYSYYEKLEKIGQGKPTIRNPRDFMFVTVNLDYDDTLGL